MEPADESCHHKNKRRKVLLQKQDFLAELTIMQWCYVPREKSDILPDYQGSHIFPDVQGSLFILPARCETLIKLLVMNWPYIAISVRPLKAETCKRL